MYIIILKFVEYRGLEVINNLHIPLFYHIDRSDGIVDHFHSSTESTSPTAISEALVCSLQIASHLARNSESHYSILEKVFASHKLAYILTHVRFFF